jgi:hypothetical protein
MEAWLGIGVFAVVLLAGPAGAEPPIAPGPSDAVLDTTSDADAPAPIERITTIGASATAGFGVNFWRFEGEKKVRDSSNLAKVLRAASDDRVVVSNLGTGQFFMNPEGLATLMIERVLRDPPDLVVAIDFLFWFTYGTVGPEARPMRHKDQRLEMLEHGLALLDRLQESGVPVVIGDIPDMSKAGGGILLRSQVPDEETRLAANERIAAWRAERPAIRFISLDRLQRLLQGDEPIEIAGTRVPESERPYLLQRDRLHPTAGGLSVITAALLAMLAQDEELGDRLPPFVADYTTLVERVTGLPQMRLQDPLERAYLRDREAAMRADRERAKEPATPAP